MSILTKKEFLQKYNSRDSTNKKYNTRVSTKKYNIRVFKIKKRQYPQKKVSTKNDIIFSLQKKGSFP
jgi:hypothetical protein